MSRSNPFNSRLGVVKQFCMHAAIIELDRNWQGGGNGRASGKVKTRNLENLSSVSGCTLKICRHRVSHTKMALSIEFCQAAKAKTEQDDVVKGDGGIQPASKSKRRVCRSGG